MAIVTASPPDSETEVIVAVNEHAPSVSVDEDGTAVETSSDAVEGPVAEDKPEAEVEAEVEAEEPASDEPENAGETDESDSIEPVQRLYRHDCIYGSCPTRWAKFAVHQDEQDALENEVSATPIVQRHVHSDDKGWITESFTVNCSHMRAFLSETLAKYQDLDPDLEGWAFAPPYKALVHRWDRLQALHQELRDTTGQDDKKKAVDQLVDFLQPILAPALEDLASTRATGKIHYDMIWQIFPPKETVIAKLWGIDTACRVVKYEHVVRTPNLRFWVITVEYVDWDGEKCGFKRANIKIPSKLYSGFKRVTSLPVYPLSYSETPEAIKETMVARGRRFQQLRGYHYLNYNGIKIAMGEGWEEEPVTGRVVIDTYAYYRSNNIVKPELRALSDDSDDVGKEEENTETENNEYADHNEDDPTHDDSQDEEMAVGAAKSATSNGRVEDLTELSEEHCLLTTPWLIGFDLKRKKWGRFLIDNLNEIVWNDKAFENLVLPGGEKELAWEFVESKAKSDESIDDFVPEKGRGLIILMFGPPGVGKTYTAEAVAEKARVPLYLVSAGMLGTSPEVVEPALTHALELCRLWNAMLLLDEADVFLGARLDDSLNRNELVSIFLTKLEYYQGILFLTTNRFSRIDYAFQSRVDLFLPYHDLDARSRRQVWTNFFEHFGRDKFDVSDDDLERLSQLPLNGREIKNLLKSAQLLNARSGGKIPAERLYMLADKRVTALRMMEEQQ